MIVFPVILLATAFVASHAATRGNSNPSEAAAICASAQSEGLLVAHENCHKFYECAGGSPMPFECPEDLNFNPGKNQCDWPENVDCSGREVSKSIFISDPRQSFVGVRNVHPKNNGDASNATAVCAQPQSDGLLVVHENCHKFYECAGGSPVLFDCPEDLNFNPAKNQCDSPDNVDCSGREVGNNTVINSRDSNIGHRNNGDPSQAPTICAQSQSDGILVAHENCHKFYECSKGRPIAVDCPPNLLYNPNREYCDWPENVDCSGREVRVDNNKINFSNQANIIEGRQGDSSDLYHVKSNSYQHPSPKVNSDPSQAASICAQPQSDSILVAHEDCNKFYKCYKGLPAAISCPDGLLYNPDREYCDWPQNVDCGDRNTPSFYNLPSFY